MNGFAGQAYVAVIFEGVLPYHSEIYTLLARNRAREGAFYISSDPLPSGLATGSLMELAPLDELDYGTPLGRILIAYHSDNVQ